MDAFLDAVRWGAVSSAYMRTLQAPFRSGIDIEEYQLDPLVRTIQMPNGSTTDSNKLSVHIEMDQAVAMAYSWDDLELGRAFHKTPQGVRSTISEASRRELLCRLLELNHQRYEEEVVPGLHGDAGENAAGKNSNPKIKN